MVVNGDWIGVYGVLMVILMVISWWCHGGVMVICCWDYSEIEWDLMVDLVCSNEIPMEFYWILWLLIAKPAWKIIFRSEVFIGFLFANVFLSDDYVGFYSFLAISLDSNAVSRVFLPLSWTSSGFLPGIFISWKFHWLVNMFMVLIWW